MATPIRAVAAASRRSAARTSGRRASSAAPSPTGIGWSSVSEAVRAPAAWGSSAGARPVSVASRNKALSRSAASGGISAWRWSRSAAIRAVSSRVVRPDLDAAFGQRERLVEQLDECVATASRSAALAASA